MIVEVQSGSRAGSRWLLRPGERLTFGRTERADVIFAEDPGLSSCHFEIALAADGCIVRDQGSTNGTWLGQQRLVSQAVEHGTRFSAGGSVFEIRFDPPPGGSIEPGNAPERLVPPASIPSEPKLAPEPPRSPITPPVTDPASPEPLRERSNTDPAPLAPHRGEGPGVRWASAEASAPPTTATQTPFNATQFCVHVSSCGSGIWQATSPDDSLSMAGMAAWLAGIFPTTLIVDSARTKIVPPPPEPSPQPATTIAEAGESAKSSRYLFASLPEEVAALVSPQMFRLTDPFEIDQLIQLGCGHDGIIAIYSQVETEILLQHFQQLMRATDDNLENRGILGLCWPSVLRAVLLDGEPEFVSRIMDPCEAILLESESSPGGWSLHGDRRTAGLLRQCGITAVPAKSESPTS